MPSIVQVLSNKAGKAGQGVANSVPNHEACFANLLNKHGFLLLPKNKNPMYGFPCYHHQPGGTQAKTDFIVYETIGSKIVSINIDLKHTNSKTVYLNDGWFHKDTIYVISWTDKKQYKTLIAKGNDIPTEEENTAMRDLLELKKKLNSESKIVGSLMKYIRFANQYKCDSFTQEFVKSRFESVKTFLEMNEQLTQSTEQEPHFQSVSQLIEDFQKIDDSWETLESAQARM